MQGDGNYFDLLLCGLFRAVHLKNGDRQSVRQPNLSVSHIWSDTDEYHLQSSLPVFLYTAVTVSGRTEQKGRQGIALQTRS